MKEILFYLVIGAICFAIGAAIINAVVSSDLPMWFKIMLLR